MAKKIGLLIGHSRKGDLGAVSTSNVSEWVFNSKLVEDVVDYIKAKGHDASNLTIVDDYKSSSYSTAVSNANAILKTAKVDYAVEFHFNSSSRTSRGYEYIYWLGSTGGKNIAGVFARNHRKYFPTAVGRGKAGVRSRTWGQRGATMLRRIFAPIILTEPFFGSNPDEVRAYMSGEGRENLIASYGDSIIELSEYPQETVNVNDIVVIDSPIKNNIEGLSKKRQKEILYFLKTTQEKLDKIKAEIENA